MRFGLEAEFALVHAERGFCDFTNLAYAEAQAVVDRLPALAALGLLAALLAGLVAFEAVRYAEGRRRIRASHG